VGYLDFFRILLKAESDAIGDGVHSSYKEKAHNGCDILFRCEIKGRDMLMEGIPLHMSIKIFNRTADFHLPELKEFVNANNIVSPDPDKLSFEPIIFTTAAGIEYFMLKITGLGPQYKALYDRYQHIGTVYKEFFPHITIDRMLYDYVKENGIKPGDITFGPLIIECGANNTWHEFEKSEQMDKGIKHVAAALGVAGALAASPSIGPKVAPAVDARQSTEVPRAHFDSERMLRAIASVESSGGKNQNHKEIKHGLNAGQRAYGKYGLTPNVIHETISHDPELKRQHGKATLLQGQDLTNYMKMNPNLQEGIARSHVKRLTGHFGPNPALIAHGWNEGIHGTYRAKKNNYDFTKHPYVKKILQAYPQGAPNAIKTKRNR
jgi:hypothetical protein